MSTTPTDDAVRPDSVSTPLTATLDLVVSALLAVAGVALATGGVVLYSTVDRPAVSDLYSDGLSVQSTVLSDQVAVDTLHNLAVWGGVGLVAVGLLSVLASALYYRARSRARAAGQPVPGTTTCAFLGAAVALLGSSIPFAPVAGGAAAGYLGRESGASVGAYAGLVASIPGVLLFAFLTAGAFLAGGTLVALVLAAGLAGVVVYYVVLGAVGGFVEAQVNGA